MSIKNIVTGFKIALGIQKKDSPFNSPRWGDSSLESSKFNTTEKELKAYEKLNWVSACVDAIARDAGNQSWHIENVSGKEVELRRVSDKITQPILSGFAGESFQNLIKKNVIPHLLLSGNAYLWKTKTTAWGQVKDTADTLIPIRPDRVSVKLSSDGLYVLSYIITFDMGQQKEVDPSEIIHFKQNTIFNPNIGVGNIAKMRYLAEGEAAAEQFQNEFFTNRSVTNLAIEDPRDDLDDDDVLRNQQLIISRFAGKSNAGKPIYLHGGMKATTLSMTQSDMQFLENKVYNRQAIISLFGLVPVILGIPDGANKAIAQTMRNGYLRDTINNLLEELAETITVQLIKDIDKNLVFKFQLYDVGDIDNLQKALMMGIVSPNECRTKLGFSTIEDAGMDEYYGSLTQIPYRYLTENSGMPGVVDTLSIKTQSLKEKSIKKIEAKYSKMLATGRCTTKRIYTSAITHAVKNANALQSLSINEEITNPDISKAINLVKEETIIDMDDLTKHINIGYEIGEKIVNKGKKKDLKAARAPKRMLTFHSIVSKSRVKLESDMKDQLKEIYAGIERIVLENLDNQKSVKVFNVDDIFDKFKESKKAEELSKTVFKSMVVKASSSYNEFFGSKIDDENHAGDITLVVENLSKNYASKTLDTNRNDLRKLLKASQEAGDDITTIKEKIEDYFNVYQDPKDDWKAQRIARTEMTNVYNQVAQLSFDDLGVKYVQVVGCTQIEPDTHCDSDGSKGIYPVSFIPHMKFHPNHRGVIVPVLED